MKDSNYINSVDIKKIDINKLKSMIGFKIF